MSVLCKLPIVLNFSSWVIMTEMVMVVVVAAVVMVGLTGEGKNRLGK